MWKNVSIEKPKEEGYYIIYFNGVIGCAYWIDGAFYDLTYDQSPDFIPVEWYQELPTELPPV